MVVGESMFEPKKHYKKKKKKRGQVALEPASGAPSLQRHVAKVLQPLFVRGQRVGRDRAADALERVVEVALADAAQLRWVHVLHLLHVQF